MDRGPWDPWDREELDMTEATKHAFEGRCTEQYFSNSR